jgi:hypothetical protein
MSAPNLHHPDRDQPRPARLHVVANHVVVAPPDRRVLVRDALRAEDIQAVADGRALAIVIPGYCPREECAVLEASLLATSDLWTQYPEGSGAEHIGTLGSALYSCVGEELSPDCQEYFDAAPERNRALREAVAPRQLPADRVRVTLDNEWPQGATLLRIAGRPTFFGLCRFVSAGGGIEPHTDRADWDLPSPETSVFRAQLFLNIYLSNTAAGGDLQLWEMEVPERADYDALRDDTSYALNRTKLPEPTTTISIEPGTLVIANASKPHAVTPCAGEGHRLSVSGFIGYAGSDAPLRVFS